MTNIFVIIYILVGLLIMTYDWDKYHKEEYKRLKAQNEVEDSAAVLYMLYVTTFWPIKVLGYIFRK